MPHPVMLIDVDFSTFSFWDRVKAAYRLLTGKRVCTLGFEWNIALERHAAFSEGLKLAQQPSDKVEITDVNKN